MSFDLWGLSVVLFEAASGCHPFLASSRGETFDNIVHGAMVEITSIMPDCPPEWRSFLKNALATDRRSRPASAGEFKGQLEGLRAQLRLPPADSASAEVNRNKPELTV